MLTRDDVIRLAREAGIVVSNYDGEVSCFDAQLIELARFVAAAEREACAVLVDGLQGCGLYADAQARRCASAIRARGEKGGK